MELAGQWRREWAGTAEFGNVTEGGVTRRVARAMEVLHASGPNAKVRVMRAAYHSSSGPGIPASSYMLHSSRRVISSGFNFLESPTTPSKPLEISSMPLETSPEYNADTENYKVTEPDDTEISEPSKWRGTTSSGNPIRMPSEESSSTDNASIIDLDSRLGHKGLHRKYSYDSENSDILSSKRSSTRASPLLDAPVTLSTLKYKSLLNGSNDWNNRRKSYSFEDTSPLNEVTLQTSDNLAMESSTDSGICKSTELVNDNPEDSHKSFDGVYRKYDIPNSYDQRHVKNTPGMFYKGSKYKSYKEHDIVVEDPLESDISLKSSGKVTITVPITLEDDYNTRKPQVIDDNDRKTKKVEFCKTELHFAAESGKVNIIATDEKPPPTNDFRKRKSAFVPINNRFEKPITLFGDKNDFIETPRIDEYELKGVSEFIDFDENTAATKSILKNKIPKPKPYLLGENMEFGDFRSKDNQERDSVPTGVSLINKQLQSKRNDNTEEYRYSFSSTDEQMFRNSLRTKNKSPVREQSFSTEKYVEQNQRNISEKNANDQIKSTVNMLHVPSAPKAKTRRLRENELTYFGIDSHNKSVSNNKNSNIQSLISQFQRTFVDDDFESVRLVKKISDSAQNSEAESEDSPEYQNLPLRNNFAPVPTPRSRVRYKPDDGVILKPIIEQTNDVTKVSHERRSRSKKQEETVSSIRSLSEPAKKRNSSAIQRQDELRSSIRRDSTSQRYKDSKRTDDREIKDNTSARRKSSIKEEQVPLYVNVKYRDSEHNKQSATKPTSVKATDSAERSKESKVCKSENDTLQRKQNSIKKSNRVQRTEKLSTPEYPSHRRPRASETNSAMHKENRNTSTENSTHSEHRIRSSQRPSIENETFVPKTSNKDKDSKLLKVQTDNAPTIIKETQSKYSTSKEKESGKNKGPIVIEHGVKTKEIKINDKGGTEKDSGTNGRRATRRSEYVIKYDDKNGTVSSISKVRGGHSASRQKHASKERKRDYSKEINTNDKKYEKSGLRNAAPRTSQDSKGKKGR